MLIHFSDELKTVLCYAADEAMRTGRYGIGTDHLMRAGLRHSANEACRALEDAGIDLKDFKHTIDRQVFSEKPIPYSDMDRIALTKRAQAAIGLAVYESLRGDKAEVRPQHLLLSILRDEQSASSTYLKEHGLTAEKLRTVLADRKALESGASPRSISPEETLSVLGEQLYRLALENRDMTSYPS